MDFLEGCVCDFRIAQWINNPHKFESRNLEYD